MLLRHLSAALTTTLSKGSIAFASKETMCTTTAVDTDTHMIMVMGMGTVMRRKNRLLRRKRKRRMKSIKLQCGSSSV